MQRKKENHELSLIENCVIRSRDIIIGKAFKLALRDTLLFASRFSRSLPGVEVLSELQNSIDQVIDDHKRSIARTLNPILKQFGIHLDTTDGFWFTYNEMRKGYILFYSLKDKILTPICVLFLVDHKKDLYHIKAGQLLKYDTTLKKTLSNVDPVSGLRSLILLHAIQKFKRHGTNIKKRDNNQKNITELS